MHAFVASPLELEASRSLAARSWLARWRIPLTVLATACLIETIPTQVMTNLSRMPTLSLGYLAFPAIPRLTATLKSGYCNTIGFGCPDADKYAYIGEFSRQVSNQALQAHDMFTSIEALSNPKGLSLHHVE